MNAGMPAFNPAFEPAKFAEFPQVEIPKGPDINEIMRESNERVAKHLEESQKQHEQFMEEVRSNALAPPGPIGGPPNVNPPGAFTSLEEARKRAEESRKRSQERLDAMRERMRKRP
jgi:hypothetical protein